MLSRHKEEAPNDQWIGRPLARSVAPLVVAGFAFAATPASAQVATGSVSVRSIDQGQVTADVTITSPACRNLSPIGSQPFLTCGWVASLVEDHATRNCDLGGSYRPQNGRIRWLDSVIGEQADMLGLAPHTVSKTVTFKPFFPRQMQLCAWLFSPGDTDPLADHRVAHVVVDLPAAGQAASSKQRGRETEARARTRDRATSSVAGSAATSSLDAEPFLGTLV